MVAERKEHVFKDLAAEDPQQQPMEIESYCVSCGENGTTRLLLTKIPHYKEVILMSFSCEHCGLQNNEIQSGGKIQEEGVQFAVLIQTERDLSRQVVKSDHAKITVPEIELEIPPNTHRGEITTVEGVLRRTIAGLQQDQPVRRVLHPEDAEKIDAFVTRIEDLLNLNQPFHIDLRDPSGNSFIENIHAPRPDPARVVTYFKRTVEEDHLVGIYTQDELADTGEGGAAAGGAVGGDVTEEKAAQCIPPSPSASTASSTSPLLQPDGGEGVVSDMRGSGAHVGRESEATVVSSRRKGSVNSKGDILDDEEDLESYSEQRIISEETEDLKNEVLSFPTNCPDCNAPAATNMKVTSIPHFKEVVIMATVCDFCGHKTNEVKSGGGIEAKGKRITLRVTETSDLSRDVLKSETCCLLMPELELEMGSHALGGKFTTLEGLLRNVLDQIDQNPLYGGALAVGDSATPESRERLASFKEQLRKMIEGENFPFTVILDDPTGNSYLQNVYAPDPDPEMQVEHYERTYDQNEDLGLNDMKVEGYEETDPAIPPTTDTVTHDEPQAHSDLQHLVIKE